jgi:hypothetical protein
VRVHLRHAMPYTGAHGTTVLNASRGIVFNDTVRTKPCDVTNLFTNLMERLTPVRVKNQSQELRCFD